MLLALHLVLLCTLGLTSQIWMDLQAQRRAESPAIPTRNVRRRDAGNRVDHLAAASARERDPSSSPAIRARITRPRRAGNPDEPIALASACDRSPVKSPDTYPARTTRRREAGRVELPRQDDADHPSARERVPLAAVEALSRSILLTWCAAQKVLRIRGGGDLERAGVHPEHQSALNRQPLLSPAPSARTTSWEARGSSNAASPSLSHTLEHRGYTGTEEKNGEAASRPILDAVDCAPDCIVADDEPHAPLPTAGAEILRDLAAAQVVTLTELSAAGVILLFIADFLRPLVFAHVNGFQVLGAELPLPAARATPMRLLERWAELAFSASALATTFMIGRYCDNGPRMGVCLLPFVPPTETTVLTAYQRRRRLGVGATFAWCTLASMAGTALADPIARALVGVAAFCGPVTYTADALHEGELLNPIFRVGAAPVASMVSMRPITYDLNTVGYWLLQDAHHQRLLRHALEDRVSAGESHLEGWAERIRPPPQELLDLVRVQLPDMLAEDLLNLPFSPVYVPLATAYLPRMPAQLPATAPHCVRSAMELLEEPARVLMAGSPECWTN